MVVQGMTFLAGLSPFLEKCCLQRLYWYVEPQIYSQFMLLDQALLRRTTNLNFLSAFVQASLSLANKKTQTPS